MDKTTFVVWHPVLDENGLRCCFDVQEAAVYQLNRGDADVIRCFLQTLSIAGTPSTWTMTPFCSVYYAGCREFEHVTTFWMDRFPRLWRVCVTFDNPARFLKPRVFGPQACRAIDPTWQEQENSWEWNDEMCLAIADFSPQQWEQMQYDQNPSPALRNVISVESAEFAPWIVQCRFNLGPIHFPDDQPVVEALTEYCRQHALSVHWATLLRMAETQGARS